jgi:hypothetical protein
VDADMGRARLFAILLIFALTGKIVNMNEM